MNEIFVFGSNLSGVHGAGAAKEAVNTYGAIFGNPEGLQGQSYAIPTRGKYFKNRPYNERFDVMTFDEIRKSVQRFMKFAYDSKGIHTFKITQVGCGRGGQSCQNMAMAFEYCAYLHSNCFFDEAWKPYLPNSAQFWGTYN